MVVGVFFSKFHIDKSMAIEQVVQEGEREGEDDIGYNEELSHLLTQVLNPALMYNLYLLNHNNPTFDELQVMSAKLISMIAAEMAKPDFFTTFPNVFAFNTYLFQQIEASISNQ